MVIAAVDSYAADLWIRLIEAVDGSAFCDNCLTMYLICE